MNKLELENLASRISTMWNKFNDARESQLNDIETMRTRIYGDKGSHASSWGSNLSLPDLWEQSQTMKAHIIDVIYSHPEGLFDVSTQNPDKQEFAIKQKAMLISAFEEMGLREQMEKIVDNIIETGECTLFVGWERRKKAVRRLAEACDNYSIEEKITFEGANVKTICASDFVFDPERVDNWNGCPKIYRAWVDLEDLKTDAESGLNNFFDEETYNSLLQGVMASESGHGYSPLKDGSQKGFKNGLVEVLEYWGDLVFKDGEELRTYKNVLVVVAGRQAVIRLEENPYVNSPFIYANLVENPQTGRGISPLKPILSLNSIASEILNKQLDAYSLIVNPPYLAPKGAFKGMQEVHPGKIIEYDASLLPQTPVPLNFSQALSGWDFIQYFKGCMESTTGIFRTMGGAQGMAGRTATESLQSANGQNARINLIIDSINRKIILPMVEKVADTIANFMCGEHVIGVSFNGMLQNCVIDNEVRCHDYRYRYSDRKASIEKQWRQKELANTVMAFSKVGEFSGKINWDECFKFSLEQLGVENSEKFLLPNNQPGGSLATPLGQIPKGL